MIDFNTVLLIIAAASCVLYGINSARSSHRLDVETKHQEFEDGREATHRENMARIAAQRDSEIAKYYKVLDDKKQIEGSTNPSTGSD